MVSLCTSMPTNRVDCSMDPSPVPEAPRQTIRRDPRSSTHRDDGSPLQAGYGHEVFCGGFAPHKPLIHLYFTSNFISLMIAPRFGRIDIALARRPGAMPARAAPAHARYRDSPSRNPG